MNNPGKSDVLKASEKKQRLEEALKRNILRRKKQINQRSQALKTPVNKSERDINNDNVR